MALSTFEISAVAALGSLLQSDKKLTHHAKKIVQNPYVIKTTPNPFSPSGEILYHWISEFCASNDYPENVYPFVYRSALNLQTFYRTTPVSGVKIMDDVACRRNGSDAMAILRKSQLDLLEEFNGSKRLVRKGMMESLQSVLHIDSDIRKKDLAARAVFNEERFVASEDYERMIALGKRADQTILRKSGQLYSLDNAA